MVFLKRYGAEAGLAVLLLLFIAFKLPDLHLPYFWDELGVYAPGSLRLKDTTISLLPGALDPEYSRGHPLLTVALYASWMRLFGDSVASAHSFSLVLGCATLLALYACARPLLGKQTALLAAAFTAVQPIFWAMSGVIMPEMLLTLFTLIAMYGLLQRRWGLYLLATSLAILTKESALTFLPAACLFLFLEGIADRQLWTRSRWGQILLAAAPILVFIAFLLVQKAQNGWYFFPLHVGYIDLSWPHVKGAFIWARQDVYERQDRWLIGLFAVTGTIWALALWKRKPVVARTLLLALLLVFCSILFASVNFYLTRYLLYVIPLVALAAAWFVSACTASLPTGVRAVASLAVAGVVLYLGRINLDAHGFQDTSDMGYTHVVRNEQEALRWAEAQPWRDSTVGANFPIFQALQDPRNGYVKKAWPYSENCEQPTRYAILWHGDDKIPYSGPLSYTVIRRFDDAFSHISILEFHTAADSGAVTPN